MYLFYSEKVERKRKKISDERLAGEDQPRKEPARNALAASSRISYVLCCTSRDTMLSNRKKKERKKDIH